MLHQKSRVFTLVIAVAALWSASAEAQGNWQPGDFGSWRFYMGVFEPTASSQYWDETFEVFTGSPSDFEDLVFGTDYLWRTSRYGGILFGVSFYDGRATQAYIDWVDAGGGDISHTTTLTLTDMTAAYVLRVGRGGVRPYIGGGGGLLWWRLREEGSFIDFADPNLPIVFASYRSDGTWISGSATAGASSSRAGTGGLKPS
jgi:hypothetical protein